MLPDVLILAGAGVGGGSLVYANTLYEPKTSAFFEDPQWAHITDWQAELAPFYEQASRMLGVVANPTMTLADEVNRKVAGEMGVGHTFGPAQVGVFFGRDGAKEPGVEVDDPFFGGVGPRRAGCLEVGACMTGCRHNAKNSLVKNYLYLAEKAGAVVHPLTTVVRVRPLSAGGYGVDTVRSGAWRAKNATRTFTAGQVVVAAGTWGALSLLHRMKLENVLPQISDRLGVLTRTNSESICGAVVKLRRRKNYDFTHGVAITSSFQPDEHTHIEPVRYGKGSNLMMLLTTVMTDGGGRVPRGLRWLGHVARHPGELASLYLGIGHWSERATIALVMQTLDNSVTVYPKRGVSGRFRLSSKQGHGQPNPTWIPAGNEAARRMAAHVDGFPFGSVGEMVDIPVTAHLIGRCVIGDSADPGVVDPYHRMFGHPGLHVVDGSAISANLGVNPALTITTQAERAMSMWPNKGETDPGHRWARPTSGSPRFRRDPAVPAGAPAACASPSRRSARASRTTNTVGRWCGHVPRRCGRPWSPIPAAHPASGEVIMTSDAALAPPETAALDRALDELTAAEDQWRRLSLAAKRDLLRECGRRVGDHATEWVAAACLGRGVSPEALIAGEEWVSGPWVTLAYTNALAETVGALARGDDPLRGVRLRANGRVGQTVVDVLPHDAFDRVLMSGFRVEVWMEAGATVDRVLETAGAGLTRGGGGGVALVLGAGNISSIAPLDVLYKLYAGNQVVILKPSPVVAAMTPVLGRVLAPFIERGFVRIADGGAEVGRYLTEHPKVGSVHMTGSRDTHDAIVFGPGEEGARRKAQAQPRLTKPVTSELGGVSPTIVLPGRWKDADLRFQAEHVASQKLVNDGFTCVASQVLVLPRAWPQADRFLEHLDQVFATANSCPAYYPGADRRQEHVLAGHRSARRYQGLRALVPDLSPDDPLLTTEVFGPVLGVVRLPGTDASTFLGEAVSFANDVVPGTLAANLIGDPASLKALGPGLDRVISRLRFGCVGVNAWTAVAYLTPRAPWGGFPGARLDDVQSGLGIVHNALLLDAPQRSVVYGPFRPAPRSLLGGEPSLSPKPPWFITNRTTRKTGQLLTRFAADPGWRHVPQIVASAMRG